MKFSDLTSSPEPIEAGSLEWVRDRALERVVAVLEQDDALDHDGEELNRAIDVLTLAHMALTFDVAGQVPTAAARLRSMLPRRRDS